MWHSANVNIKVKLLLTTFTKTFELRSILVVVMQKYQIAEKGKFRFSIDNKKKDHFLHFQSLFLQFRFYRLDHLHHHFQTQKNWVSFKS